MSEQLNQQKIEALVDHFLSIRNFDHLDMEEVVKIGKSYDISEIDSGKAFFVARERAALKENEILDGGDGSVADKVNNYGQDSIHQMLFENES